MTTMKGIFSLFLATALVLGLTSVSAKADFGRRVAENVQQAQTAQQLDQAAIVLEQLDSNLQQTLMTLAKEQRLQRKMEIEMRAHLTPQELVPLFFRQAQALTETPVEQMILRKSLADNALPENSGGISGKVVVGDVPPGKDEVKVFAFDGHGYYAGSATVDSETGGYTIAPLKSDSFYVVTRSDKYVDEIYDNVTAPLGSLDAWRLAKMVFVPSAVVSGVDFNLQRGVLISGSVQKPDGMFVDDGEIVDFIITSDRDSTALVIREVEISEGRYQLLLPATGKFKIQATVDGFAPTWAYDQHSWRNAQVVEITDFSATPFVDFKVSLAATSPVGEITGTVKPAVFALTAAFNARDTSFVRMGISIGFLEVEYTLPDLPPGDYFVYADDYLGTLIGGGNSAGEFYDGPDGSGVRSIRQAKPVTVFAAQATDSINFSLDVGTTVRGLVTDAGGAPLDSLTLLLVNAELLSGDEPFLARLEVDIVATDFKGEYEIPGLKPGRYILRTLSDYFINFDLGNTDSLLLPGKHKGKVIDQYYGGELNLLRLLDADRLVVQGETELLNNNFVLQLANKISGKIAETETGLPVKNLYVIALEDSSGYPFYPWALVDDLGRYELRSLPMGKYRILALTGFKGETDLLSEFYGGERSFYTASVVDLNAPLLENVDFSLEKGATIEGFVIGIDGKRLSADALDRIPVVAYHAGSGKVASYDFMQFNGGYRINRLLPGAYKVATIPAISTRTQLAVSYWGGGASFDDVQSQEIVLDYGDVAGEKDLHLKMATGRLYGFVADTTGDGSLSGVFVGAYDLTGHLAGYALTDIDPFTGEKFLSVGEYSLYGLAPGEYYVRTVALFMAVPLVEQAMGFVGMFNDASSILGFLFGGNLGGFNLNLPIYKDYWHQGVPATITVSLDELLFQASAYGLANANDNALAPIYLPLPFYEMVPSAAQKVVIKENEDTRVDFLLSKGGLNDLVTQVDQPAVKRPAAYALNQNYPNPFNPSTTISFELPENGVVEMTIYDTLGRQVMQLALQIYPAGSHAIVWNGSADDGSAAAAGLYFVRMNARGFQKTIKLVLMK